MSALRFLLNGEPRAEDGVPPATTVLDWLRGAARLTGTKEGCAEGDCGACTIAVARPEGGWQAVNSCLMLLPQLDGCKVMTVEGLSRPGEPLHEVQQALVDAHATQCGFCTPGFAMAMFAFAESGEPAEDAAIHEALAGNLCRCTGYRSIVDACRTVSSTGSQKPEPHPTRGRGSLAPCPPDTGAEMLREAWSYAHSGQKFHAPRTLSELLALRAEHPQALLLAGGTDLGLRASKGREALPLVISTAGVDELRFARETDDALDIGAACTYSEALLPVEKHFPAFGALIRRIGSRQIRNLGTFAGNLATASPIGDTLPCLIALGATVMLASVRGTRSLAVEDFVTGYRKADLGPDEVIASIRIPYPGEGERFSAYKLSKRFDQDISTVVAAFRLSLADGKVASLDAVFGGMAARPARAAALESALREREWTQEALRGVDALLAQDFSPLSDFRAGAQYRLRAAAGLVRRFQLESGTAPAPVRLEAL